MQAELWQKVEELYHAVLPPPGTCAQLLAQADAQVRAQVQSLLDQNTGSFLESAPLSAIKTLGAGARPESSPAAVGQLLTDPLPESKARD